MNESRLESSIVLRMVIIAGLTLVLLIPALFVESLVTERSSRRAAATQWELICELFASHQAAVEQKA